MSSKITENLNVLFNLAKKFYNSGDLDSVACVYKNILLLDPDNESAKKALERILGIYYIYKGRGHIGCILGAEWSHDGKYLFSYGTDNFVGIWDYEEGRIIRLLDAGGNKISTLAVHPKEYKFAVGTYDGDIIVYEAFSCQKNILRAHDSRIVKILWTPEGRKFVSADANGNVIIWDDKTKKIKLRMESYGDRIDMFKWSVGGRYLLGYSVRGNVNVWNPRTGRILYRLNLPTRIHSCDWSPRSENLVVGTSDGSVIIYELRHNTSYILGTHDHIVSHVFWTKDNRIISVGWDRKIKIWDAYDLKITKEMDVINKPIIFATISKSDRYLALGMIRHYVEIIDLFENQKYSFEIKDGLISSLQWRPSSNVISVSTANRKLFILNVNSRKIIKQMHEEPLIISCLLYIPTMKIFVLGLNDGSIAIFDSTQRRIVIRRRIHGYPTVCMSSDRDYTKVGLVFKDGTIALLELPTLNVICKVVFPPPGMKTIRFNPAKDEILLGHHDGKIRIIDSNCNILEEKQAHNYAVSAACWNKKGDKFITASSNGEIKIWDRLTMKSETIMNVDDMITCLDWNKRVNYLALGTIHGRVIVVNLDTFEIYTEFRVHRGPVESVKWSKDGVKLSSCGSDGKLVVYQIVRKSYKICPLGSPTCDACWGVKNKELYCGCANGDLAIVRVDF